MEIIDLQDPKAPNKGAKLHVPLIKNTKVLEEGDVLMRYQPGTKTTVIELKKIPAGEPPQKRRRTKTTG